MEHWTSDIWLAIVVAFVVGIILGYVVLKATNDNLKKQQKLANDLKEATAKLDVQKEQLEQHFEQSANLLATLAEDYKKLYTHLAKGSQVLLPEEANNKIEFFQKVEEKTETPKDNGQPKDYTEGSSGILKS